MGLILAERSLVVRRTPEVASRVPAHLPMGITVLPVEEPHPQASTEARDRPRCRTARPVPEARNFRNAPSARHQEWARNPTRTRPARIPVERHRHRLAEALQLAATGASSRSLARRQLHRFCAKRRLLEPYRSQLQLLARISLTELRCLRTRQHRLFASAAEYAAADRAAAFLWLLRWLRRLSPVTKLRWRSQRARLRRLQWWRSQRPEFRWQPRWLQRRWTQRTQFQRRALLWRSFLRWGPFQRRGAPRRRPLQWRPSLKIAHV